MTVRSVWPSATEGAVKVLVQCPISVVNGGVLNDDMVHRVGLATRDDVEHDSVIADVNRLVIFLNESNTDSASVSWQRRYCCLGDGHRLRLRSVDTVVARARPSMR